MAEPKIGASVHMERRSSREPPKSFHTKYIISRAVQQTESLRFIPCIRPSATRASTSNRRRTNSPHPERPNAASSAESPTYHETRDLKSQAKQPPSSRDHQRCIICRSRTFVAREPTTIRRRSSNHLHPERLNVPSSATVAPSSSGNRQRFAAAAATTFIPRDPTPHHPPRSPPRHPRIFHEILRETTTFIPTHSTLHHLPQQHLRRQGIDNDLSPRKQPLHPERLNVASSAAVDFSPPANPHRFVPEATTFTPTD
jgi:hypothetical protein